MLQNPTQFIQHHVCICSLYFTIETKTTLKKKEPKPKQTNKKPPNNKTKNPKKSETFTTSCRSCEQLWRYPVQSNKTCLYVNTLVCMCIHTDTCEHMHTYRPHIKSNCTHTVRSNLILLRINHNKILMNLQPDTLLIPSQHEKCACVSAFTYMLDKWVLNTSESWVLIQPTSTAYFSL